AGHHRAGNATGGSMEEPRRVPIEGVEVAQAATGRTVIEARRVPLRERTVVLGDHVRRRLRRITLPGPAVVAGGLKILPGEVLVPEVEVSGNGLDDLAMVEVSLLETAIGEKVASGDKVLEQRPRGAKGRPSAAAQHIELEVDE